MTQELTQAQNIISQAKALQVHDQKQAKFATEVLSKANKALDLLSEREDERTARLKEELAFIKAPYIEPKKALKEIIADLRDKLGAYQTAATRQAAIEAQAIADKALKGRLKPETAVRKLEEIDAPEAQIDVESGSLSFRSKQVLVITDLGLIPRSFLVPDEILILEWIKRGEKIPGCTTRTIQVPYNRRK